MAEFAAAVGLPTETGKAYLGEALELRHRLPQHLGPGAGPVTCRRGGPAGSPARPSPLSPAAAGFVDAQVAPFAHRIRPSGVDRLVEEAIVRFMPEPRPGAAGRPPRMAGTSTCTPVRCPSRAPCGCEAEVDLADALDLDTALSVGAARLADLGSAASLDVRRSEALGEMARHQLSLDLDTTTQTETTPASSGPRGGAARAPLRGRDHRPAPGREKLHLARVANTRSFVDADQVRAWCGHPGTTVTVRPVVDLAEHAPRRASTRSPTGSPPRQPSGT